MMQQGNGADGRYLPPAVGMDYSAMEAAVAATHPSHHHPHHHHSLVDPPPHIHYGLAPPPPGHLHHHPHQGLQLQQPQSSVGLGGVKRNADSAGLDMMAGSDSDEDSMVDVKPSIVGERGRGSSSKSCANDSVASSKKTRGRVKIKMEFIDNKLRRYTTFSKRKTGIMKKAYELSTLTGTQVMLLVASETGHVYTFATRKLQPMITSDAGKALIQTCLNSPDPPGGSSVAPTADQRMSATGYEETELTYNVPDDVSAAEQQQQQQKVRQMMYAANSHYSSVAAAAAAAQQQQQQQHNLFGPQSSPNGGGLGPMQHHSPYGHPAPSPSPSAMHHSSSSSYGVTASLSPSSHSPGPSSHHLVSHSPPFAVLPQQQQHPVAGR